MVSLSYPAYNEFAARGLIRAFTRPLNRFIPSDLFKLSQELVTQTRIHVPELRNPALKVLPEIWMRLPILSLRPKAKTVVEYRSQVAILWSARTIFLIHNISSQFLTPIPRHDLDLVRVGFEALLLDDSEGESFQLCRTAPPGERNFVAIASEVQTVSSCKLGQTVMQPALDVIAN
jgi:hypothetical protein